MRWDELKLTSHPLQTYYDKLYLQHPLGNEVPATYIAYSKPYFATTQASSEIEQRTQGWTYLEIPTAYNAMSLMPDKLTQMLLAIS